MLLLEIVYSNVRKVVSEKKIREKNINIHTESRVRYEDSDDDTQTCARLCASKKSFIVIHHDRDDGIKYNLVYSVVSAYRLILPQYLSSNTVGGVSMFCCMSKGRASEEKSSKKSSKAKQK